MLASRDFSPPPLRAPKSLSGMSIANDTASPSPGFLFRPGGIERRRAVIHTHHITFYTHCGEEIRISAYPMIWEMLSLVPGVTRASDPIGFLLKNGGWAMCEDPPEGQPTVRFNGQSVSEDALVQLQKRMHDLATANATQTVVLCDICQQIRGIPMSADAAHQFFLSLR